VEVENSEHRRWSHTPRQRLPSLLCGYQALFQPQEVRLKNYKLCASQKGCGDRLLRLRLQISAGIKTPDDVEAMGIEKYNEECRAIVMRYSQEWRQTVTRLGRWIDFDNDYKTLHTSFMESVWWVFGQLWEKGLVYRGFKVLCLMHSSTCPSLSSCSVYHRKSLAFVFC
jgi:hypothetical protein